MTAPDTLSQARIAELQSITPAEEYKIEVMDRYNYWHDMLHMLSAVGISEAYREYAMHQFAEVEQEATKVSLQDAFIEPQAA